MLTASLQSTWEAQQRGRQKPKSSLNFMEEIDSKNSSDANTNVARNNILQISPPSLNRGNSGSGADITELPNLRIPQVKKISGKINIYSINIYLY